MLCSLGPAAGMPERWQCDHAAGAAPNAWTRRLSHGKESGGGWEHGLKCALSLGSGSVSATAADSLWGLGQVHSPGLQFPTVLQGDLDFCCLEP